MTDKRNTAYNSDGIKTRVSGSMLMSLRAEGVKAALDKAWAM